VTYKEIRFKSIYPKQYLFAGIFNLIFTLLLDEHLNQWLKLKSSINND